jgi:hypothetical protein
MIGPADYRTYVVRHWRRDDGSERVEIEYVQSGAKTRLTSLAEALAWIETNCGPAIASLHAAGGAKSSGSAGDALSE